MIFELKENIDISTCDLRKECILNNGELMSIIIHGDPDLNVPGFVNSWVAELPVDASEIFPKPKGVKAYMNSFFYQGREFKIPESCGKNCAENLNCVCGYKKIIEKIMSFVLKIHSNGVGNFYVMVDEKNVKSGQLHRRGGAHVDGTWRTNSHYVLTKALDPAEEYFCDDILILCATHPLCLGYVGLIKEDMIDNYSGEVKIETDEQKNFFSKMKKIILEPYKVYAGLASQFVHESIPAKSDCTRQLIRINVNTSTNHKSPFLRF